MTRPAAPSAQPDEVLTLCVPCSIDDHHRCEPGCDCTHTPPPSLSPPLPLSAGACGTRIQRAQRELRFPSLSQQRSRGEQDGDRCACGHSWDAEHEQTRLFGGICTPRDGSSCDCPRFTPAHPVRDTGEGRR